MAAGGLVYESISECGCIAESRGTEEDTGSDDDDVDEVQVEVDSESDGADAIVEPEAPFWSPALER